MHCSCLAFRTFAVWWKVFKAIHSFTLLSSRLHSSPQVFDVRATPLKCRYILCKVFSNQARFMKTSNKIFLILHKYHFVSCRFVMVSTAVLCLYLQFWGSTASKNYTESILQRKNVSECQKSMLPCFCGTL
jgi:hypothetical protein